MISPPLPNDGWERRDAASSMLETGAFLPRPSLRGRNDLTKRGEGGEGHYREKDFRLNLPAIETRYSDAFLFFSIQDA